MRLRQRDLKTISLKVRDTVKEPDGTTYEDWINPFTIQGNKQPSGGKQMVEMYGERLRYMFTIYSESTFENLQLADLFNKEEKSYGACIYSTDVPDYKVVAMRPWNAHIVIDIEKVRT